MQYNACPRVIFMQHLNIAWNFTQHNQIEHSYDWPYTSANYSVVCLRENRIYCFSLWRAITWFSCNIFAVVQRLALWYVALCCVALHCVAYLLHDTGNYALETNMTFSMETALVTYWCSDNWYQEYFLVQVIGTISDYFLHIRYGHLWLLVTES